MFWTTEKVKENLEHFSKYGVSMISEINEEYSPQWGKTELIHINTSAFNNSKINISGEDIIIMCTEDTHIVTFMAPVYNHGFFENEMDKLNHAFNAIHSSSEKSFVNRYINGILYVSFAIKSQILDVGLDQCVFPNAFSYIMAGIEEIGETVKNVRNKLSSVYRSLGY